MVNKIRQYWFGTLIFLIVAFVMGLVCIVSVAPHNDEDMRGFTPCTFKMAEELSIYGANRDAGGVVMAVFDSYVCYIEVISKGIKLWSEGKQEYPWDNFLFEPRKLEIDPSLSEPFSDDLIKANKLNDENGDIFEL